MSVTLRTPTRMQSEAKGQRHFKCSSSFMAFIRLFIHHMNVQADRETYKQTLDSWPEPWAVR